MIPQSDDAPAFATDADLPPPDLNLDAMRRYRLDRLRAQMRAADIPLCILTNPASMRYATDFRNYPLFQSRVPIAYLYVPLEGPVVICGSLSYGDALIDEGRPASYINFFNAGPNWADEARRFAEGVGDFLREIGVPRGRVALEHVNPSATQALLQHGLDTTDALPLLEYAKVVKSQDEVVALQYAVDVAELGMTRMRRAMRPGITENQLWSILHQTNIAHDGEWFDGRMLASGTRTNPWFQDATSKVLQAGELVGFDTDMLGPNNYCADVSRTWFCGPGTPTATQRELYRRAHDELQFNTSLFRPGVTFRDIAEKAYVQPERYRPSRYTCIAHGVGIGDEYPKIFFKQDWAPRRAYDGALESGMCLCVESYVGEVGGHEGVKLEDQILVTDGEPMVMSKYPFEEELLH